MHLLYLDESGSVPDKTQQFFILAGVSVFERKAHWVENELNGVAKRFSSEDPYQIELHGSPMRSGRDGWNSHPLSERLQAIKDSLQFGVKNHSRGVVLFGAVIRKSALVGDDVVTHAFEQISSRFDCFLRRQYLKYNDPQRGLILFDKSSTEQRIQT
ncbi:DUF3800 domain-containing protein, partial [Acidithiobacillus thiooxidans]